MSTVVHLAPFVLSWAVADVCGAIAGAAAAVCHPPHYCAGTSTSAATTATAAAGLRSHTARHAGSGWLPVQPVGPGRLRQRVSLAVFDASRVSTVSNECLMYVSKAACGFFFFDALSVRYRTSVVL